MHAQQHNPYAIEIINRLHGMEQRLHALEERPDFQILSKDRLQNLSLTQHLGPKAGGGLDPIEGVLCDFFTKTGNAVTVSVHVDILPDYNALNGAEPVALSDVLLKVTWGTSNGRNYAEISAARSTSFTIACQSLRIEAQLQNHIDFYGPPGASLVGTSISCALGVGTVFDSQPVYRNFLLASNIVGPSFSASLFPIPKYSTSLLVNRTAIVPGAGLIPISIFEYMNSTENLATQVNQTDVAMGANMQPIILNPLTQMIQIFADQAFTCSPIFMLSL